MTQVQIEIHDDVLSTINKIKNINDSGIDLIIPEGSVLFDNIFNLKLIQRLGDEKDMNINLITDDEIGNKLINSLNGKSDGNIISPEYIEEEGEEMETKKRFKLPKIKLPKINLKKLPIISALVLLILIGGYIFIGKTRPEAEIKVVVKSDPLTRSITIRVVSDGETSIEDRTLKGAVVEALTEANQEGETTGEKIVGEAAEGKIIIYNKTDTEIELDEGDIVTSNEDDDLEYEILDDVIVPAGEENLETDPPSFIFGEAEAEVRATDIGEDYNIDQDSDMQIDGYQNSELSAKVIEDIDGGKSEIVAVVTQEDIERISNELLPKVREQAQEELENKIGNSQKLISGSTETTLIEQTVSHEPDEESETVNINQKVAAKGLTYLEANLNNLLDNLVKDLVPEGYELSEKEREVKVEILGNATNTVLNSSTADLQVTLKTEIIPVIDEEEIKNKVRGKSVQEAQEELNNVRNITSFVFNLKPRIPFFSNVPNNNEKISIEIENE